MRTVEIKLYQYDKLSPKEKEKALAWAEENLVDDWEEGTISDWIEKLKGKGIKPRGNVSKNNIPLQFDLYRGYCKLNTAWIETKFIEQFVKDLPQIKIIVDLKNSDFSICNDGSIDANRVEFETIEEDMLMITESIRGMTPEEEWDLLCERIDESVRQLEKEILKDLQEAYDYATSEEALRDTMMANEYDFTEDGKRW